MSATRVKRAGSRARPAGEPARSREAMRAERRRRERHFRLRRRDLLLDAAMALGLTVILISVTAGLGVLALLELPIALGVAASVIVERVRQGRRGRARDRRPQRGRP